MSEQMPQPQEENQLAQDEQWVDFVPTEAVPYLKQRNAAEKLAETDELTGLMNRRGLMNKLDMILSAATFDSQRYVLLYMDLNGFKKVNDTYGHKEGDQVLQGVASRLNLRKSDMAARIGGDEFVVIADTEAKVLDRRNDGREDSYPRRMHKDKNGIIKGLTQHLVEEVHQGGIDAGYAGISASVGVQELNGNRDPLALIDEADKLMQQNKQASGTGR